MNKYKYIIYILIAILVNIFSIKVHSQNYIKLNAFTTNEGLPSNHIYEITEDNKGFLWIATDNGISRFDGKYFQNFSVKDGLPSNDVLQIVKEIDGTIWANCYKEPPCYFDEKNNRFIKFTSNELLNKVTKNFYLLTLASNGGIGFEYNLQIFFLKNKQLKSIKENYFEGTLFFKNTTKKYSYKVLNNDINKKLFLLEDNIKRDSIFLQVGKGNNIKIDNNCFSWIKNSWYFKVVLVSANPFIYTIDSINFNEQIVSHKIAEKNKSIITTSKGIYILKENSCRIQSFIRSNTVTNVCIPLKLIAIIILMIF